jgi:hypothetical protein
VYRLSLPSLASTLLAAALLTVPASAQPGDPRAMAVAHALHEQASAALDAKDYASACPKLEQVVKLVPTGLGAQLSLAECYEGQGRLATAWATYLIVEAAAAQGHQPEREQKARTRAEALKPRLSHLTIAVSDLAREASGIEVRCDGRVVPPAEWGVTFPVDPGAHVVAATARGKQRWERDVEVKTGGPAVTVTLDALADIGGPVAGAPPGHLPLPPVPPEERSFWSARHRAGVGVGAAGVVVLAVGAGVGLHAISTKSDSDAHCNAQNRCDATGVDLRASSLRAGDWSTGLFIGGGVALATGVVLLAVPEARSLDVALGPRGLTLHGTW